jgi:hypothetical protein
MARARVPAAFITSGASASDARAGYCGERSLAHRRGGRGHLRGPALRRRRSPDRAGGRTRSEARLGQVRHLRRTYNCPVTPSFNQSGDTKIYAAASSGIRVSSGEPSTRTGRCWRLWWPSGECPVPPGCSARTKSSLRLPPPPLTGERDAAPSAVGAIRARLAAAAVDSDTEVVDATRAGGRPHQICDCTLSLSATRSRPADGWRAAIRAILKQLAVIAGETGWAGVSRILPLRRAARSATGRGHSSA